MHLDVGGRVVPLPAVIGQPVGARGGQVRGQRGHEGVLPPGVSIGDLPRIQGAVARRAGDDQPSVSHRQSGDLAARRGAQIANAQQLGRAGRTDAEVTQHEGAVLDPRRIEVVVVDGHGLDVVIARRAELDRAGRRRRDRRQTMNLAFAEGLDVTVPAAHRQGAGHGRPGPARHIDPTVCAEGDGRRLVLGPGAAPLGPLLAAVSVKDGDEAVRRRGRGAGLTRNQGADDGSGHGHPPVRIHGDGVAAGLGSRAQRPADDHIAGRIQLHQDDVRLSLDRLGRGAGADIGHDPHRTVRPGRAGPHRLDAVGQAGNAAAPFDPEALARTRDRIAVGIELQDLVRALAADALNHLNRIASFGGREADRLHRGSADRQTPARGPGRQGDGLVARLHRARFRFDHLAMDARLHARRLQLAVDVLKHGVHRPRGSPHLGQVDVDRLAARHRLHRDAETHIALEGGDLIGQGAVVDRTGQILGIVSRHGRGGLALGRGDALDDTHAVELGRRQEILHLGHARGETARQLF
ncbi:hypothetical protein D3C73_717740 [compost metagenome]